MVSNRHESASVCQSFKDEPAEIFQVDGDYCLECWQERAYPFQLNTISAALLWIIMSRLKLEKCVTYNILSHRRKDNI